MGNTAFEDKQRETLEGVINGLTGRLKRLAPHPSRPGYRGPLFIANHPSFKPVAEYDGMLGSMMLESLIGSAFAQAASDTFGDWCENIDATAALECYSTYITDIEDRTCEAAAHGQGTLARLSGKSIAGAFNLRSHLDEAMQAFLDDLPERLEIERDLAWCARRLGAPGVPQPAAAPLFKYAA